MTNRPKSLARMTGLFFLITLLTGIFAQGFVAERLIVHGDAAATAGNVLIGWLIFRATVLPRWLGALSIICGLGWTTFASPTLGYHLFNYLAVCGLLGSVAMIGWLLVKGVNEERWKEQNGLHA